MIEKKIKKLEQEITRLHKKRVRLNLMNKTKEAVKLATEINQKEIDLIDYKLKVVV